MYANIMEYYHISQYPWVSYSLSLKSGWYIITEYTCASQHTCTCQVQQLKEDILLSDQPAQEFSQPLKITYIKKFSDSQIPALSKMNPKQVTYYSHNLSGQSLISVRWKCSCAFCFMFSWVQWYDRLLIGKWWSLRKEKPCLFVCSR